jgi:hypothetical protein
MLDFSIEGPLSGSAVKFDCTLALNVAPVHDNLLKRLRDDFPRKTLNPRAAFS